jgi:hypothetical protein
VRARCAAGYSPARSVGTSRLAKVEASLSPREVVLVWLVEAQRFASLVMYTRSSLDLPDAATLFF